MALNINSTYLANLLNINRVIIEIEDPTTLASNIFVSYANPYNVIGIAQYVGKELFKGYGLK